MGVVCLSVVEHELLDRSSLAEKGVDHGVMEFFIHKLLLWFGGLTLCIREQGSFVGLLSIDAGNPPLSEEHLYEDLALLDARCAVNEGSHPGRLEPIDEYRTLGYFDIPSGLRGTCNSFVSSGRPLRFGLGLCSDLIVDIRRYFDGRDSGCGGARP